MLKHRLPARSRWPTPSRQSVQIAISQALMLANGDCIFITRARPAVVPFISWTSFERASFDMAQCDARHVPRISVCRRRRVISQQDRVAPNQNLPYALKCQELLDLNSIQTFFVRILPVYTEVRTEICTQQYYNQYFQHIHSIDSCDS
ncbi:Hypothetical_protein [Hexamita inflata]|uniref:Hypothetical_protein n=1 Tax=Hexamita inflata TaxID=28002 RepID=A0AA86NKR9_9EUKA|nr:Hypothetical protein HINF_LOCUS8406 [Hexamita inflata]